MKSQSPMKNSCVLQLLIVFQLSVRLFEAASLTSNQKTGKFNENCDISQTQGYLEAFYNGEKLDLNDEQVSTSLPGVF